MTQQSDPIDTSPSLLTATFTELTAELAARCVTFLLVAEREEAGRTQIFHHLAGSVVDIMGLAKWADMEAQKTWIEERNQHE